MVKSIPHKRAVNKTKYCHKWSGQQRIKIIKGSFINSQTTNKEKINRSDTSTCLMPLSVKALAVITATWNWAKASACSASSLSNHTSPKSGAVIFPLWYEKTSKKMSRKHQKTPKKPNQRLRDSERSPKPDREWMGKGRETPAKSELLG